MNLPTGANGDHFVNAVSGEVVKIQVNDARMVGHVHLRLKTTACRVRKVNAQLVVRRSITNHIVVVVAVEICDHDPCGVGARGLPARHGEPRSGVVRGDLERRCDGRRGRCGASVDGGRSREHGEVRVVVVVEVAFVDGVNVARLEEATGQRWREINVQPAAGDRCTGR